MSYTLHPGPAYEDPNNEREPKTTIKDITADGFFDPTMESKAAVYSMRVFLLPILHYSLLNFSAKGI